MHILPVQGCWVDPFPYYDPELDRLRRLARQAEVEAEKRRLRQRLRELGVNPNPPCLPRPCMPVFPRPVQHPCPIDVSDVLRKIPH